MILSSSSAPSKLMLNDGVSLLLLRSALAIAIADVAAHALKSHLADVLSAHLKIELQVALHFLLHALLFVFLVDVFDNRIEKLLLFIHILLRCHLTLDSS
eukprot:IDg4020t1